MKSQRGRETSPREEKPIACIAFQTAGVCDWQQIFTDFPGVGMAKNLAMSDELLATTIGVRNWSEFPCQLTAHSSQLTARAMFNSFRKHA